MPLHEGLGGRQRAENGRASGGFDGLCIVFLENAYEYGNARKMLKHIHGIGQLGHGGEDHLGILGPGHAKHLLVGTVAQNAGNVLGAQLFNDRSRNTKSKSNKAIIVLRF